MKKEQIQPAHGPRPGGAYSPGLRVGDFVFVSGQGAVDPETGAIVGETIEAQTERTLENVRLILEAAGATLDDVVKATVHLSDLSHFPRYNAVYSRYFNDPKPTRTTVGSQLLGTMLIEIDVIAYVGEGRAAG